MVPKKKGFFIAKINSVTFKGVHWEFSVSTTHRNFLIHSTDIKRVGASVGIRWNEEDIHVMWKEIDE
jgi:spermidine/putrescine transport system ATP-binding protein